MGAVVGVLVVAVDADGEVVGTEGLFAVVDGAAVPAFEVFAGSVGAALLHPARASPAARARLTAYRLLAPRLTRRPLSPPRRARPHADRLQYGKPGRRGNRSSTDPGCTLSQVIGQRRHADGA